MARKGTVNQAERRAASGKEGATPSPRLRCPLATLDDVKRELAKLYREAKSGQRDVGEASRLGNLLAILGRMIEGADIERRIVELEERAVEVSHMRAH